MTEDAQPPRDIEWITATTAETMIQLALGVSEDRSAQLLHDAVQSGEIEWDSPVKRIGDHEPEIRVDMAMYPGGFTAVNADYDERLSPKYAKPDVEKFIERFQSQAPTQPSRETNSLSEPPKRLPYSIARAKREFIKWVAKFSEPDHPSEAQRYE